MHDWAGPCEQADAACFLLRATLLQTFFLTAVHAHQIIIHVDGEMKIRCPLLPPVTVRPSCWVSLCGQGLGTDMVVYLISHRKSCVHLGEMAFCGHAWCRYSLPTPFSCCHRYETARCQPSSPSQSDNMTMSSVGVRRAIYLQARSCKRCRPTHGRVWSSTLAAAKPV